ncbi:Protein gamma response 1 [Linum perenne]
MEQLPPKNGRLVDHDDVKYVSRLSTILVATIEEAKDRISQIEYIFCNQLYPNVQSKYKNSQEVYLEAKKQAEEGWKEKEIDLLLRIEKLEREKQGTAVENQSLKLEKDKLMAELKNMMKSIAESGNEQGRISLLEEKLASKSAEVDEGVEMSNRLIRMVQTKSTMIVEQSKQLKEYEEKSNSLVRKVEGLEGKVESLVKEMGEKDVEIARQKKLIAEMETGSGVFKSTIVNEEKFAEAEVEKMKLKEELRCMEEKINELERNLNDKTREVEQERVLQEELREQVHKQADTISLKSLREELACGEDERVKQKFIVQIRDLEEKVKELQNNSSRTDNETKLEQLLKQIQAKDAELLDEKEKKRDLIDAYKRLKSQYNYLREKCGLISENVLHQTKLKDGDDSLKHHNSPQTSPDLMTKGLDNSTFPLKVKAEKIEHGFNDELEFNTLRKAVPNSRFQCPPPSSAAQNRPPTVKPATISGVKRPASGWIETRPGQSKRGADPRDDFLSTPLENLRANNLIKAIKQEEAKDIDIPAELDANPPHDSSDDETQNMNVVDPGPGNQDPAPAKNSFKYVETVRKKADRENLKGVECKQCKKFYDAVLPEEGGGNNQNVRCEHHEGVSRHRYRYVPPSTPDGFWNIGFESEM